MKLVSYRLITAIPVLALVSVMVFMFLQMLPGDPATVILGVEAGPEEIAQLREELGLNQPLFAQYWNWLLKVLQGDLGNSLIDKTPVIKLIAQRLPATLELMLGSFLVALLIALPTGILAAAKSGKTIDHVCSFIAMIGMSIPHFWLGMMCIIFFAVKLGVLPASGYVPFWDDPIANLQTMILPIIATGFRESAVLMRMVRSSLLEVMNADYIRTARAKGLSYKVVMLRHALKNAMIPVITTSGIMIASLLGGLIITESIFSVPGYGKLIIDSVFNRDYVTVQGALLVSAIIVVVINIIVDCVYGMVDPRIKLNKGE